MPRNMSFALTTRQMLAETKTVTRRAGWANLKPGELFWAVEKAMGLKPGEKVRRLKLCRCVGNRPEPLDAITPDDVAREGFPEMTPTDFVVMFRVHMGGTAGQTVNRIEFEFLPRRKWKEALANG